MSDDCIIFNWHSYSNFIRVYLVFAPTDGQITNGPRSLLLSLKVTLHTTTS